MNRRIVLNNKEYNERKGKKECWQIVGQREQSNRLRIKNKINKNSFQNKK